MESSHSSSSNLVDDDDDLILRIRQFLTRDLNFREPEFDPAPYLIKVLKEKEANQELLVLKQAELIEMDNEAYQLVVEAASDKSQQFFKLLDLPKQFGLHLEGLKNGMSKVKKKVKETKGLLLATQKDIQQIHLNCMFNKLIYKSLKEVELKLDQYETAALALKNHLYFDCAINLPAFAGHSVLETTLAARTENLKLRFLSQAIEELRLFLYFTPRVTVPVQHSFLDKLESREDIFNESTHASFYKRYLLFRRAKCEEYLSSIWSIAGLDERNGKVATVDGIIKGVMKIGKVNEITDSLSLDCRKSVSNIFTVLLYFFAKDSQVRHAPSAKKAWATSPETEEHTVFLSALFCISAALLRKCVIVRRICSEYQLKEVVDRLASERVLEMVRDEMLAFVGQVYFADPESSGHELSADDPVGRLRKYGNYAVWPYFKRKIEACLTILVEQLSSVQKSLFDFEFPDSFHFLKSFSNIQKRFNELFHAETFKEFESIFPEGRGLVPQNYDTILSAREHRPHEIEFVSIYVSEERKALREFVNLISLLTSLTKYFNANRYDPERLRLYSAFMLIFFYLKVNSAVFRSLISPSAYDKIVETRLRDGRIKNKEKHIEQQFATLASSKEKKKKVDKKFKILEGDSVPLRNAEQLKMVRSQLEMLLYFCLNNLTPAAESMNSVAADRVEGEIDKHEPSNYDDNLPAKLVRVWEQLVKPFSEGEGIELLLAGVYRRMLDLYLTLTTSVYLETGAI